MAVILILNMYTIRLLFVSIFILKAESSTCKESLALNNITYLQGVFTPANQNADDIFVIKGTTEEISTKLRNSPNNITQLVIEVSMSNWFTDNYNYFLNLNDIQHYTNLHQLWIIGDKQSSRDEAIFINRNLQIWTNETLPSLEIFHFNLHRPSYGYSQNDLRTLLALNQNISVLDLKGIDAFLNMTTLKELVAPLEQFYCLKALSLSGVITRHTAEIIFNVSEILKPASSSPITYLDISHNSIKYICSSFLILFPDLRILDISYNNIAVFSVVKYLPEYYSVMWAFELLFLHNNIEILNCQYAGKGVETSYSEKHQLAPIWAPDFVSLFQSEMGYTGECNDNLKIPLSHNLRELNINNWENIDMMLFNGKGSVHLKHLCFKKNNLQMISAKHISPQAKRLVWKDIKISGLDQIQRLDFSENEMEISLNSNFFQDAVNLQRLDISKNSIAWNSIAFTDYFPALEYVSLSDTDLSNIPDNIFSSSPMLKELDLSQNNISTCISTTNWPSLQLLNLSDNAIQYCSANYISALQSKIGDTKLSIDLSNNNLVCNCSDDSIETMAVIINADEHNLEFTGSPLYSCDSENGISYLFSIKYPGMIHYCKYGIPGDRVVLILISLMILVAITILFILAFIKIWRESTHGYKPIKIRPNTAKTEEPFLELYREKIHRADTEKQREAETKFIELNELNLSTKSKVGSSKYKQVFNKSYSTGIQKLQPKLPTVKTNLQSMHKTSKQSALEALEPTIQSLDTKKTIEAEPSTSYICTDPQLDENKLTGNVSTHSDLCREKINNKDSIILDGTKIDDYELNVHHSIKNKGSNLLDEMDIEDYDNRSKHNELTDQKNESTVAIALDSLDSISSDDSLPDMKLQSSSKTELLNDSDPVVDICSKENFSISSLVLHSYEKMANKPNCPADGTLCSINATADGGLFKLKHIAGAMYIPPDVLSQSTQIQVIEYDTENIPDLAPASKMYELHPHGQQFREPVMFKFPLSLKHVYNVNAIRVMYSPEGYNKTQEWIQLPLSSSLRNDFAWFIWRGHCYISAYHFCTIQLVMIDTEEEKAYPLTALMFGSYTDKKRRVEILITFACDQPDSKDKLYQLEKKYGPPLCEQPVLIYQKAGPVEMTLEPENAEQWHAIGSIMIKTVDHNLLSLLCQMTQLPKTTFHLNAKDAENEMDCMICVSMKQQKDKYPNQQPLEWHLSTKDEMEKCAQIEVEWKELYETEKKKKEQSVQEKELILQDENKTKDSYMKIIKELQIKVEVEKHQNMTLQTMLAEISGNTLKKHEELHGRYTRTNRLRANESDEKSAGMLDGDLIQLQDEECLIGVVNGHSKQTEGHNNKNEAVAGHSQYNQSPSDIPPIAHSMNVHIDQQEEQPEQESANNDFPSDIAAKPKTPVNVPHPAYQNVDTVNQMLHYNGLPSPLNTSNAFGSIITPNGKEGAPQNILVVNKIINNIYHNNTPECIAIEDNTWPEGFCRDFRKYLFHVCVAMDKNKPKLHELAKSVCIANTNGFDAKQFVTSWYMQQIDEYENNNNTNKIQDMWFRLLSRVKKIEFAEAAAELTVALEKTLVQKYLCVLEENLNDEGELYVKLHSQRVLDFEQYKKVKPGGKESIRYLLREVILESNMEGFNHFKLALKETRNDSLLMYITLDNDNPVSNGF